ncbi:TetR/AcrR family transcriptional regulator C-terminal domain-containing protein [Nonomuraea sp. K274]|uniref:TetR/AcrR family transcriptional regulator C-terminal domain-containing protein n=1 Tax=Nonomuraea cypriaca TaxID=1187855 RepID=A0A931AIN8_9ACTN|nr:TetR/AcrR family transcriptional regulator C-terminal domain-containing protein [Nonomuraea cypriaca]MBF8193576.1 TetR/AcrR family transcriptional regulator C-terminal domain-containing protein [Nonomuraea cypriaca]
MSSLWTRPTPPRRPALTREAIVAAAIAIADAEGIAAVSIRRVAAELGARAMTLYSYIERKEDLLALMLDEVAAEVLVPDPLPDGWRAALLLLARRERELVRRHPWRVDLISQRVPIGPNALRHVEQKLSVFDGLGIDRLTAWRFLAVFNDYMTGFVVRESLERAAPRQLGINDAERAAVAEPYIKELVESGEFARLAPMIQQGVPGADDNFERGLDWVLDGLEHAAKAAAGASGTGGGSGVDADGGSWRTESGGDAPGR